MKKAVIMPKEDPQKLVLCLKLNKIGDPQTLELGTSVPDLFIYLFIPGTHYVPFKFPMGSHQVLNMFPKMFSIAPHFYPICFGKCCPPFIATNELYTSK